MEIDRFVKNEQESIMSGLVHIHCKGDNPQVAIGSIVDISMSVRNLNDFLIEDFGKFLITSVSHQIDGIGHYHNTFQAIPADTERVPVSVTHNPQPDMQLADVIANDDPQGQGRVKVKFKWACQANDDTEWLRVVSPNAGTGDTGANRGFHVIPEKGDQVVIAFEEGNIARPVVMGSVYHGKSGDSKGFKNSNTKGLTSRKGSALSFDDLSHALYLGTNAGNFINIKNGQGKITAQANDKIVIHTGDSTITLNKDGHVAITGKTLSVNFSESIDIQSAKITIGNLAPAEGATPEQQAAATQTIDVKGKAITVEGEETINGKAKETMIEGTDKLTMHSPKEANIDGGPLMNIKATKVKLN
ncbi:phage baseplate assembly protein V [Pedobacter sp. NJ-S-72]